MAAKAKGRPAAPTGPEPLPDSWRVPPQTTEDRLARIQLLGQRIDGYIRFMRAIGTLQGTSAEAKDGAVALFYERLVTLEQELARIQENLQLG